MYKEFIYRVFLPVCLGAGIYAFTEKYTYLNDVKNYLPDGLWAFGFVSCLLLIWNEKINTFWMVMAYSSFIVFEYLQKIEIIGGTADVYDIFVYFAFSSLAIVVNKLTVLKKQHLEKFQ